MVKYVVFAIVIVLIGAAGCLEQFWLTPKHSSVVDNYIGKEPKKTALPFSTLGEENQAKQQIVDKHLTMQVDLEAAMRKDEGTYGVALGEVNVNIQKAKTEFQGVVGTIAQPGFLMSILIALVSGYGGRILTTMTHYSESELQTKITEVKNGLNSTTPAATTLAGTSI